MREKDGGRKDGGGVWLWRQIIYIYIYMIYVIAGKIVW